jgi:hypothetical protein
MTATQIGVCGFWYHCIGQHDRLWKRHYTLTLPHLNDTYSYYVGGPAKAVGDLPSHLILSSGSSYARAWLWSQRAYTSPLFLSAKGVLPKTIEEAQPLAYARRGLARARYHLPSPAVNGYLSSDSKLLATVHKTTLLPPGHATFTTVALYRVADLHGRDVHRSHFVADATTLVFHFRTSTFMPRIQYVCCWYRIDHGVS